MNLENNSVHIWLTRHSLIPPEAVADYYALMNRAERTQSDRYQSRQLRDANAITRGLQRTVLSQYRDFPRQQWEFGQHEKGKPFIASPDTNLFFNISHSREWIVCAVAMFPVLGIDVEDCMRNPSILSLAHRYFSQQECAELTSLPEEEQASRFFDYWTLKEAYVKARGEGVSLGLDKFSFSFTAGGGISIDCNRELRDDPQQWQFRLSGNAGDHRMALAARPPVTSGELAIRHFFTVPGQSKEDYSGALCLNSC